MFKHILVPLDGSRLAERSLGLVASLAKRFKAKVTLIHMLEKDAPTEVHQERHLTTEDEAAAYLDEVAHLSVLAGVRESKHVHTAAVSDVAESVRAHSVELEPDLVVMTTHGRRGAREFLFGDLAQQVIARGKTPVLVVRSGEDAGSAAGGDWRVILAPIDADPSHEGSLSYASDLALAFHCRLELLMAVPTLAKLSGFQGAFGLLLPGTTRVRLEIETSAAWNYVKSKEKELRGRKIRARGTVARGDAARMISKTAQSISADLIVMGTHGRVGAEAFWAGSVAAQVVANTRVPLLLLPLGAKEAVQQERRSGTRSPATGRHPNKRER